MSILFQLKTKRKIKFSREHAVKSGIIKMLINDSNDLDEITIPIDDPNLTINQTLNSLEKIKYYFDNHQKSTFVNKIYFENMKHENLINLIILCIYLDFDIILDNYTTYFVKHQMDYLKENNISIFLPIRIIIKYIESKMKLLIFSYQL